MFIPEYCGLSLIRNTDRLDLLKRVALLTELFCCFFDANLSRLEDLERVVLMPAAAIPVRI